ncbi:MAG: transporter associated domain-containing protein [Candidatus Comchoanobacterales bacterium]
MFKWLFEVLLKRELRKYGKETLSSIIQTSCSERVIDANQKSMINGCLMVSQLKVRDLMVPRYRAICIDQNAKLDEILPVIIESQHSRFPVMSTENQVMGVLLAKRLINSINKDSMTVHLSDYIHPVHIVPDSKRIDGLLSELKQQRSHMAIAVDEYNNFNGIITIEDILEEIVGDIEDEDYEPNEPNMIKKITESHYIVNGLASVENLNKFLPKSFNESQYYDTLGGLLLYHFGYIPNVGELLELNELKFKILNTDGRRIRLVEIRW